MNKFLHDHFSSTLKELHWLPIKQRVDYKLCLLVHKVVVGHAPSYLTDMLTLVILVSSQLTLHDALNGDYIVPRTFLNSRQTWNRLPTELKLTHSKPAFKRSLKTFLLQTAYCSLLDRTKLDSEICHHSSCRRCCK